ncbi:heme ABC transporter ATP-binding protein [Vibrio vulnificus]|uniref:heme ABC transporter ATP-binding protein n=1 Tax=Vibrio vulnificus TaxID=672 RepID=UPI000CD0640B|nr:heme ABC transporter ATP-binding protein [Vibrio vulnificus]EGQ7935934.1 heme ABC transporter ATP-binding protein [Vibrio vulnificus]EGQ7952949.1 heme ABC transporter ATP-binding protein [Vibrio vulnificus]EGQ7992547.1 heme ABC transporter ATP-binding protein [Vibrio vulnificus]EGS1997161.1 heme ABC transporter ATP-binding protein [Vibrio vulnificus]EHD2236218.1 heme ABC transporter ATP-binding protein [Vibrio vulnificus]
MKKPVVLRGQNLSLQFASRQVLKQIDVAFCAGEVVALLGPNGAGKSSLLKLLSGEIASSQSIEYFGKAAKSWRSAALSRHLGLLPQSSSLTFPFLAREVVELGAIPLALPQAEVKAIAEKYMAITDVVHLADSLYPALSGGEKQRLHFARVLTQLDQSGDQKILMLDEPTSALDLAHQHNTLRVAKQFAKEQQACVIVVLHDLNLAAQYADRMVILHRGEIVVDANPEEALTPEIIDSVYGYKALIGRHPTLGFPLVQPAA